MLAKIITIGDEILVGQTIDTNSAYIAKALNSVGIEVSEIVSISDTSEHIKKSLDDSIDNYDFVIITGGLGPTIDDITKHTLVDYFNDELIEYPDILKRIETLFKRFNKPFLEVNRLQAMLPKSAKIIINDLGTASGMWFKSGRSNIISLPGVPFEMIGLIDKIISEIKEQYNVGDYYHKTLLIAGIGESFFADKIKLWEGKNKANAIGIAYLPAIGLLKLRLTGKINQTKLIDNSIEDLKKIAGKYIVGINNESLEQKIGSLLIEKKHNLGTIESCTGGALSKRITSTSGSSSYYKGSIISYSNEIKSNLVGVNEDVIEKFGAVSEEVVTEMAIKGRIKLNVDYCISISGIAGPDGGTEKKPVGLIWIAIDTPEGVRTKQFNFGYNRARNIESSVIAALNFLRLILIQ